AAAAAAAARLPSIDGDEDGDDDDGNGGGGGGSGDGEEGHTPAASPSPLPAETTVFEMDWMSVRGWASKSGSGLGTSRFVPSTPAHLAAVAASLRAHDITGLVVIGGNEAYRV